MSKRFRLLVLACVLLVLIGVPAASLWWMTAVPGRSFDGPLPRLSAPQTDLAARLQAHVRAIASVPHNVNHPQALEASASHIETGLQGLGYAVQRQPFAVGGLEVRNIEAVLDPARPATETLVVGAHYDSWGESPGANDNGSGTAAVLELARLLVDLRGRSALRIRFVLFVNEEPPYFRTREMGSLVYARRLVASGERIRGMLSLETMGFFSDRDGSQHYPSPFNLFYPRRGNFIAFVGPLSARGLVRESVGTFRAVAEFPSVGGTAPGAIQGINWSDHWAFMQVGVPALMVTDTAPFRYPHYHSAEDRPDKIDYDRLARVVTGLERMLRRWASPPAG
ncbi:M28 family peptidase [Allosphingosinicella deserti]|nr:M28 family peptidase [Sphingomonas deserti]